MRLRKTAPGRRIGVGNGDRRPLPPNPVCSFPASNEFDHIWQRDFWLAIAATNL